MADITIEQAIALRDTISSPTFIINNLLHNEGMETYVDMACSRMLELVDEHPEYQEDIYLDIMEFNVRVTVVGFWLIKNILLSYISEEKWQEYMKYIKLKNEQIQTWNDMIKLLRGFNRKQLINIFKEADDKFSNEDKERMQSYVKAELKARSIKNKVSQRIMYFIKYSRLNMRAFKIKSLLNARRQQIN
jgi:hypothetical protein